VYLHEISFCYQSSFETRHKSAAIVIASLPVVLFRLAYRGTDAGTCRASNNRTLQSAAEDRTEDGTTSATDERALTGPYAALLLLVVAVGLTEAIVVAVLLVARIVVLSPMTPIAEALVEIRRRMIVPSATVIRLALPLVLRLATSVAVGILAETMAESRQ
jgi:hypothetical protein